MINFTFSIDGITFDQQGYLRSIGQVIRDIRLEAAKVFLRTAFSEIPVWSGMSAGTYLNLSRLVNIAINISPLVSNLKYYAIKPPIPKTPESGIQLSKPIDQIFTEEGDVYYFNMSNTVIQFRLGEFGGSPTRPAPWASFEKGTVAFIDYVKTELPKRLPNIKNFMIKETRTVSVDGTIRVTRHKF